MTKIPNWHKGGGKVVFAFLAKHLGLKTFIETGSGFGDTAAFMHPVYEHVYSIELDDWKYELCKELFQFVPNVEILHGDSSTVLPALLDRIENKPTFFWLDAHGMPGQDDGPLGKEVKVILEKRPDALIAIDDVGQNTHHDVEMSSLKKAGINLNRLTLDYRFGRIMFIHKGQYSIPEMG